MEKQMDNEMETGDYMEVILVSYWGYKKRVIGCILGFRV